MTEEDFGITKKTCILLMKAFESFTEIEEVILFGSRAKGNYKKGSDIDIAVKGDKVTARLIFRLSAILNERLPIPYFVDVLSYSQIENPDLLDHINRVGKDIYKRNKTFSH